MADQVTLQAAPRTGQGKGPTKRLRATGRVPAIVYGGDVEPVAVSVDALELYHVLHTEAGGNVLIRLQLDADEHLCIIREIQRHALRGDVQHCDFQAVKRDQLIPAEIPVHVENEDAPRQTGGIVNTILYTVPILVTPLEVPSFFTLDLAGMQIGDVRRVEDLSDQLPEGAEFDIDLERTVLTINAPTVVVEDEDETTEALDEFAGEDDEAEAPAPAGESSDEQ